MTVIQLIGVASGHKTKHDGRYVVFYDAKKFEFGPPEADHSAWLQTTDDISHAKKFKDTVEAGEYWAQSTGVAREFDGKPDRPLTAFTISFCKLPDSGD